jgi:hypothetical protein
MQDARDEEEHRQQDLDTAFDHGLPPGADGGRSVRAMQDAGG